MLLTLLPGTAFSLHTRSPRQAARLRDPPLRQLHHQCRLPVPHVLCWTRHACGARRVAALPCTCTHLNLSLQELMNHHYHPDAELVPYDFVKSPKSLGLSATQDCRRVQSLYSLVVQAARNDVLPRRLQRNVQPACEAPLCGSMLSQAMCRICS